MYQEICTKYSQLLEATKVNYFKQKVTGSNQKQLFKFVDEMLNVKMTPLLPKHESTKELAERFSEHFESKIVNLRRELSEIICPRATVDLNETCCTSALTGFQQVSMSTLKDSIMSSKSKSCELDPIPTWLLKDSINILLPTITTITNTSLEQGTFPLQLKRSIVRPLIKKTSLDPDESNNFRPISNLPFLSKTLERIVASQMNDYLTDNKLYAKMQSAYRKYNSTETALLRVVNDITRAIDDQQECVLVLLDLSSAFDTIDHQILLNRLKNRYGFSGQVLDWLTSYLQERSQRVAVDGVFSQPRYVTCGVPQGSVLGPLLFSLYIAPLEDVISSHGISVMMYADDSQLYIVLKRNNRAIALEKLELCIDDVMTWIVRNMLKCNPPKTEVIHFYSRYMPAECIPSVKVGGLQIETVNEVKDLGVTLDSNLTFKSHIKNVCRSASHSIHYIGKIRKFLSPKDIEKLIHAFISSKLDYCNGLFYGLPSCELQKLQRLQNTAARLVTGVKKSEHITPILINLHWLPVEQRIIFKLLLVTYKALHGLAPDYIMELLHHYTPARTLRSSNSNSITVPKSRTKTYGDNSFSSAAPRLWNALPNSIKLSSSVNDFKAKLKTHLFKLAFNLS